MKNNYDIYITQDQVNNLNKIFAERKGLKIKYNNASNEDNKYKELLEEKTNLQNTLEEFKLKNTKLLEYNKQNSNSELMNKVLFLTKENEDLKNKLIQYENEKEKNNNIFNKIISSEELSEYSIKSCLLELLFNSNKVDKNKLKLFYKLFNKNEYEFLSIFYKRLNNLEIQNYNVVQEYNFLNFEYMNLLDSFTDFIENIIKCNQSLKNNLEDSISKLSYHYYFKTLRDDICKLIDNKDMYNYNSNINANIYNVSSNHIITNLKNIKLATLKHTEYVISTNKELLSISSNTINTCYNHNLILNKISTLEKIKLELSKLNVLNNVKSLNTDCKNEDSYNNIINKLYDNININKDYSIDIESQLNLINNYNSILINTTFSDIITYSKFYTTTKSLFDKILLKYKHIITDSSIIKEINQTLEKTIKLIDKNKNSQCRKYKSNKEDNCMFNNQELINIIITQSEIIENNII